MASVILPGDMQQPRVVTFAELVTKLAPVLMSWGYLDNEVVLEIHDLWKLGAPAPSTRPGMKDDNTKRVLIHTQFNKWWREAMQRAGMTITPREAIGGRSSN